MSGNCSTISSCFNCSQGSVNCTWYDIWRSVGECQPGSHPTPLDAVRMVKWEESQCTDGPVPTTIVASVWSSIATYYSIIITMVVIIAILGLLLWWKIKCHGYRRFSRYLGAALNSGFLLNDVEEDDDEEVEFTTEGPIRRAGTDSLTLQTTVSTVPSTKQQPVEEEVMIAGPLVQPVEMVELVQAEASALEPAPENPAVERKSGQVKPPKRYGFDDE